MRIRDMFDHAGYALYQAHLRLLALRDSYAPMSREQRLMTISAGVVCAGLLLATSAHAQQAGDGVAGMVTTAGTQADTIKTGLGKIFTAAGFGGAGIGGWNLWRKGKEGEQSHIKGSQVAIPIAAGAILGAIGFVLIKAGETVGIQRSDLGTVPN